MIKILIADDHEIVRTGIRHILQDASDIEITGEAKNGNQVLEMMDSAECNILLLDVSMPGPGFQEIMRRLGTCKSTFSILVLSMHPESQYALRAIKAGAAGYLTKNHSPDELLSAIRHIHSGHKYISASLGEQLADDFVSGEKEKVLHNSLSEREFEIMCMLGRGSKISEISKILSLSPKTISTYRVRIFEKMEFKNISDLVLYVAENNLS